MNSYELKQEARRERLEKAAENAEQASHAAFQRSQVATAGIPFGQPILIGHHSESRHRNALKRSDNAMRKACELTDAAKELNRRAEAVGTGGISSDDPDAIAKLEDKRTDLERMRDAMKAANTFYRTHKTLPADLPEALRERAARGLKFDGVPFPAFSLTNLGARIRDAKKRAVRIEAVANLEGSIETVGLATITVDPTENRVSLAFPSRLTRDDYKAVRSAGFVWSPTRNAFVRKISNAATYYARSLAERITTLEGSRE